MSIGRMNLNDESIYEVMGFLPIPDLRNFRLTCRHIDAVATDYQARLPFFDRKVVFLQAKVMGCQKIVQTAESVLLMTDGRVQKFRSRARQARNITDLLKQHPIMSPFSEYEIGANQAWHCYKETHATARAKGRQLRIAEKQLGNAELERLSAIRPPC